MAARPRTTPRQLRALAWAVSAMAVFVLANIVRAELSYADLAAHAVRVPARITRIDVRRSGRRIDHVMHYACEVGGRTYQFFEGDDRDRLEELHTATVNGFVGPDAPFEVGKTFALLVDPKQPERHRPDRAQLGGAWLLLLRDGLALLFLGGLAGLMHQWARSATGAADVTTRKVSVATSTHESVLRVQIELDVPWPDETPRDELSQLRARMPTRKLGRPSVPPAPAVTRADVSLLLRPSRNVQLDHAFIASVRNGAQLERTTLSDDRALRAGKNEEPLRATVELPVDATSLEIEVRLASGVRWTHSHVLRAAG